jgi:hypothetical protein
MVGGALLVVALLAALIGPLCVYALIRAETSERRIVDRTEAERRARAAYPGDESDGREDRRG